MRFYIIMDKLTVSRYKQPPVNKAIFVFLRIGGKPIVHLCVDDPAVDATGDGGHVRRAKAVPLLMDIGIEDRLHPVTLGLLQIGMAVVPHMHIRFRFAEALSDFLVEMAVAFGRAKFTGDKHIGKGSIAALMQ